MIRYFKYVFFMCLLTLTLIASCHITKGKIKEAINVGHLTQLYLNEDIVGHSKYSRKYLINYSVTIDSDKKRVLRFDSLCTAQIVDTKVVSEIILPKPHFALVSSAQMPNDYKHNFKINVHPIYKAKEVGNFCFIVSSGYNIEYSGEEWAILYKPYYNDSGELILGDITEDYIRWF